MVFSPASLPALRAVSVASVSTPEGRKPGDTLLGVQLVELLGRGPNGAVWTARDAEGRTVALKICEPRAEGRDAIEAAFRRGVATLNRADYAGERGASSLVRLHAVSLDQLAFVYDYYDNGSAAGIPALGWGVPRILEFFGRVCRAVAWLHENGITHRSLKPSNILVDDDLAPILTDAGMLAPREPGLPLVAADVTYQAPEELGDESVQSPSADIFGLGCLLWFLLQGSDPDEPYDTFAKLPSLNRFPPGLVRIVRRATARDPAARYQWVEELDADIARYREPELVGIGNLAPGEHYPRYCISSLPAAPKLAVSPAVERRTAWRSEAPSEQGRVFVRVGGWLGLGAVLAAAAVFAALPVPTPLIAELAGAAMTLGLASATLFLPSNRTRPVLFRLAAFGAALAVLIPLELDRLVIVRWKLTLDSGSDEARVRVARLLARSGARDLRGARLARGELSRADLGRADLRMADLRAANLSGANLAEANLAGADLRGADLSGATLLSSNAAEARGWPETRCTRSTAMPERWGCAGGRPVSNEP